MGRDQRGARLGERLRLLARPARRDDAPRLGRRARGGRRRHPDRQLLLHLERVRRARAELLARDRQARAQRPPLRPRPCRSRRQLRGSRPSGLLPGARHVRDRPASRDVRSARQARAHHGAGRELLPEPAKREQEISEPSGRYWHGKPWSEKEQADWIEAFYTICYSKPEIEAVTWWNFSDPAFIPHGGFVDEGLRPKEGYRRLRGLIDMWGTP